MSFVFQRPGLAIALVLALAGCKTEVYDQLSQRDANEMSAALFDAGIDVDRTRNSDGLYAVSVPDRDFALAVRVLDRAGLPSERFKSFDEVFDDESFVPTPTEERARLNYAKSQELSRTVSEIDGVTSARVHLVIPEIDPLSRAKNPASASVAIRHAPDFDTTGIVPRIKLLVANSVEDLNYDRVTIALFPTRSAASETALLKADHRRMVEAPRPKGLAAALAAGLGLFVALIAGAAAFRALRAGGDRGDRGGDGRGFTSRYTDR